MEFERIKKNRLKINMTPLIDMVFLLVVFFMLTTSFNVTEIIELGFSSSTISSESQSPDDAILIEIKGTKFFLNGDAIKESALRKAIILKLRDNKNKKILLNADAEASVQDAVKAMDIARIAGGTNIILLSK